MSRIGASPIHIPAGTTLTLDGGIIAAKGGNGAIAMPLPPMVELTIADGVATVRPTQMNQKGRSMWGTARALISNMVVGVSTGFTKNLVIRGVGYRAQMQGNTLVLSLGLSHPVQIEVPQGIKCSVENLTQINLASHDKRLLGQFAAEIRAIRPPEPYKGKGVRYETEQIIRKEGKKK